MPRLYTFYIQFIEHKLGLWLNDPEEIEPRGLTLKCVQSLCQCLLFKFKFNVVVNDLFMKRVIKIRRYVSMVLSIILLTLR